MKNCNQNKQRKMATNNNCAIKSQMKIFNPASYIILVGETEPAMCITHIQNTLSLVK